MPFPLASVGPAPVRDDSLLGFLALHAARDAEGWPVLDRDAPPLPEPEGPGRLKWAPGARDGVGIFHTRPTTPEEAAPAVDRIFASLRAFEGSGDLDAFEDAASAGALPTVEALLQRLVRDAPVTPGALAALACAALAGSAQAEAVKLAAALAGILQGGSDFDPALRLLAVHDEFTLYAGVALISRGADPEATWLAVARRVRGWGRVHAVDRLCMHELGAGARRWLLTEGAENDVLPAYTALPIARRADAAAAVADAADDPALLDGLRALHDGLRDEGPCAGYSAWDEGAAFCAGLAEALARAPLSPERFASLLTVREAADALGESAAARARDATSSVVGRADFEPSLAAWLRDERPEARAAARKVLRALGRDATAEAFFEIERDPLAIAGWYEATDAVDEAGLRRLVERARAHLAPDALATGPTDALFDPAPRAQCFEFVLQALQRAPHAGADLLAPALAMPSVRMRFQALRAAARLPPDVRPEALRDAIARCAEGDPEAELRDAARAVAAGEPFPDRDPE